MRRLVSVLVLAALVPVAVSAETRVNTRRETVVAPAPVVQQPEPQFTITLSEQDRRDLKRIEDYFNALPPLVARFVQTSQQVDGSGFEAKGQFKLWRPGRLRIEYDPPNKDFVVADGTMIYQWDSQMHQQSQTKIEDTLAGFILKRNLNFSGDDVTATKVEHPTPRQIQVTLRSVKDPGAGELTLVLEDVPMKLAGWIVKDAQGLLTSVVLSHVETGFEPKREDFVFRNPEFGGQRR